MGRSKFPGKPSKHTNRKRVNVLPPTGEPFHIEKCPNSSLTVDCVVVDNKQDEDVKEGDGDGGVDQEVVPATMKAATTTTKMSIKRRLSRKMQTSLRNKTPNKRNLLGKMCVKTTIKTKLVKSKANKRGAYTDTNKLVGKFVLPTRSVHSSRVIKPNKRFLNVELSEEAKKRPKEEDKPNETPQGRVILRQARLKLHTQSPGPEGPFSSSTFSGSPPGTVTCGVCGAVRFYRFVKQARKFNIYSCESCRKFISKMIKRQACSATPLVCHKGQGTCHVPPIVRSQQWKLIRSAYRARCPACWLKMCLRSFQIPVTLKHNLTQLLPKHMHNLIFEPELAFTTPLPLLWSANPTQDDTPSKRPVRFKKPLSTPTPPSTPVMVSEIKRQKIDLKGPRVKHVCRSASIVLGQPLATFEDKPNTPEAPPQPQQEEPPKLSISRPIFNDTDSSDCDKINDELVKREKPFVEKKRTPIDHQNTISIDFWEGYDPDDVCQNGFCLIASEQLPMPAICFLCGSAGREPLLYCSNCCEPYHTFCLEQTPPDGEHQQGSWLCPRCTSCSECHLTNGQKLNCQKCWKAYHRECFNKKWNSDDRPTVCSKCLRCRSCGGENITKFVGNIPLCITCFKSRKKGNFCPICQHCYDDNECCAKMMECGRCKKWVHLKCEKLSEEQYQMLSILPESIEFFCQLCSEFSSSIWRQAVDMELQASFSHVLRLLSKNKTARNMLKWSPMNNPTPTNRAITNVKRLQFSDDVIDLDNNNYSVPKELPDIKIYTFNEENEKLLPENKLSLVTSSLVDIKNKLNSNEYSSVSEFNREMEEALNFTHSEQLLKIYYSIFKSVFPWFEKSNKSEEVIVGEALQANKLSQAKAVEQEKRVLVVDLHREDTRMCSFCKKLGDSAKDAESRLLYCGQNEWVHANCALWSSEVYEEIDGSLQNVHSALSRGRLIRCSFCKQKGASVGCCFKSCYETFHFHCARLANCHFLHDKHVYCNTHSLSEDHHPLTNSSEFEIHRSVFVELDRKRRKHADIDKVNFMIGSLCVTNLGRIYPGISDNVEAIVPMNFMCTRLYWSTIEPWKLVPYYITTSVVTNNTNHLFIDRNFTLDHTLPKPKVEKIMREITLWQKDLDKKKNEIVEYEDDEEPQNGADLLSPELTDAILEELPNDLLDGISVQDIFPKFMNCDDLISLDLKSDLNVQSKSESDTNTDSNDDKTNRELRRSKSEILPLNKSPRVQQRSCSLTVSCKVDSSLSPVIKKRKMQRENNMFFQLLQVDGNFDDSSSSECGSPTEHSLNPWGSVISEEPVTCEKCQSTYRTQASYKRHLETCEILCTSESDSEMADASFNNTVVVEKSTMLVKDTNQPLLLKSYESFQNEIHTSVLNTQTFVTASKSTEMFTVPPTQRNDILMVEPKSVLQTIPVNTVTPLSQADPTQGFTISHPTISVGDSTIRPATQYCVNQTVPFNVSQPLTLQPVNSLNQISINALNQDFNPVTIQSVPFNNTPILNVAQPNQFKLVSNPLVQTVNVPTSHWVKQVPGKPTIIAQKTIKTASAGRVNRGRVIAAKRTFEENDGTIIIPTGNRSSTTPVIVQHLPSTNFVPTFVDTFQQQNGQNLQYVATIAPQVNTTQSLIQIQPDNNVINLVPNLQPTTMIIQQPRVLENQLVLDSNGSLGWASPAVQPVYYGFETIVQNTVMQSQQFLPTTMPGVLTANSSYSTTTQVFQTSKLEPVLDVASNSFVLMNGQLVPSSAAIAPQYSQPQSVNILSQTTPQPVKYSTHIATQPSPTNPLHSNSITLPTAPFVPEQTTIPMNVVVPTPKPPTTVQSRPMSRVLPMPTNIPKEPTKPLPEEAKKPEPIKPIEEQIVYKLEVPVKKLEEPLIEETKLKESPVKPTPALSLPILLSPPPVKPKAAPSLPVITSSAPSLPIITSPAPSLPIITSPAPSLPIIATTPEPILPVQKPVSPAPKLDPIVPTPIEQEPTETFPILITTPEVTIKKPTIEAPILPEPQEKENTLKPDTSLKLIFQKQGQDGVYKISNNFHAKSQKTLPPAAPPLSDKPQNQLNIPPKKEENGTSVVYTIETHDGFKYSSNSIGDLWEKVYEAVQNARSAHNMPPLPRHNPLSNFQLMGLKTNGLRYLIEQLPGAGKCLKYKPAFKFQPLGSDLDDEFVTSGHSYSAIRCAPYDASKSEPYDMFGWLSSKHRRPEEVSYDNLEAVPRRSSVTNLPMAMRFRQLKLTSKYSVGVYRSPIHGRGLFCLRGIEAGEMVIEYAGEVIRSILTDKREKYYNTKAIGCYMFRVDDNFVVDATMKGNAARFINHSCDPNCYSKVVEILGHKHIIIFALRRIVSGEELTYDYKFPFEEDKIPCTCGSRKCRKFLN